LLIKLNIHGINIDGESGSGKSALLLQLAINAQQSENTVVIYSPNSNQAINVS
jgi:predicted ATP-dependent serine protease